MAKYLNKKNKYKVIFDTNMLYCDGKDQPYKVFNSSLKEAYDFIEEEGAQSVILCLPQLVIDERVSQRLMAIEDVYNGYNKVLEEIKKVKAITNKSKEFNRSWHQKKMNNSVSSLIKECEVELMPTVKVDQNIVVTRALKKSPPFTSRNGDKGFKDTLIWLTLLEDAKNNQDYNYLLLTNDQSDFNQDICQEEFKHYSGADFVIKNNMVYFKEYLDEKLKLNLELKKVYKKIEEKVLSLQGTITSEVGFYLNNNKKERESGYMREHFTSMVEFDIYGRNNKKDDFSKGSFDFYGLDIQSIVEIRDNFYSIKAELCVKMINNKKQGGINTTAFVDFVSHGHGDTDKIVKYNIDMNYDNDIGRIKLLSATKDYRVPFVG